MNAANPLPHPRRRLILIGLILALVVASTGVVPVRNGDALVVTRFGAPVRIVTDAGLSWSWPAPIEHAQLVNRRLRTTATGSHGVLSKDGLSLVVQVYAAWRITGDADAVLRFVRATGGNADAAAGQLRTLLNSALETVSGRFALADLVNADPAAVRIADYEAAVRERVAAPAGATLGIEVVQIGMERLSLPEQTLQATVARMAEERMVAAQERQAAGRRAASEVSANANREARIIRAGAEQDAAAIEARAKAEAAAIYGTAHAADPGLYVYLRSLDVLEATLAGNARLVLSTESAPFQALLTPPVEPAVHGPPSRPVPPATAPSAPAPPAASPAPTALATPAPLSAPGGSGSAP
jgi:membrane protease subunit HflC